MSPKRPQRPVAAPEKPGVQPAPKVNAPFASRVAGNAEAPADAHGDFFYDELMTAQPDAAREYFRGQIERARADAMRRYKGDKS